MIDILLRIVHYSLPVALAGTGETVCQRSGVINIGLEGQMLAAAFAAMMVTASTGNVWLGMSAAVLVALIYAALGAWMVVWLRRDQVVVGTATNLLALGVCGTMFEKYDSETGQLVNLPLLPKLFRLSSGAPIDALMVATFVFAVAAGVYLYRSRSGLRLRSAGEYPPATEAAGFNVEWIRTKAMLIAGALAGMAGGYLVLGISGSFTVEAGGGRGFIAIAMVTFGRWRPAWVLAGSLLVGSCVWLQNSLQISGSTIPTSLLIGLPYVATLAVMLLTGKGSVAPSSLGVPYKKRNTE